MNNDIICDIKALDKALSLTRKAQKEFAEFSQEQVDKIFYEVAILANKLRIPFAKMAYEETQMGVLEDKVIKNHLASEFIYNKYKNEKTCGVIEENEAMGIEKIACPVGTIGAIVPVTNPTSTTIFKILIALKTKNGIVISPHPSAKKCTIEVAKALLEKAVEVGAPQNIISWIDEPSLDLTMHLMRSVDLILATGGQGLVKSAYSSGKPAIGVGAGNTPAIIDSSADILSAVNSIIHSKTFDNGLICASEQAVVILGDVYEKAREEFGKNGCYFLSEEENSKIRGVMFSEDKINSKIVGQNAYKIASLAGIKVDPKTKILIGEVEKTTHDEEFSREKLSPILAMYKAKDFDDAIRISSELIEHGGLGHTSSIFIDEKREKSRLNKFKKAMKTCRILINTPASQGGVGDIYNFDLPPSLTLGCGTWGGNSTSENVGIRQLLNVKMVAKRKENMLWFRVPERVYLKRGCFKSALYELKSSQNPKKAFIVTDRFLFENGYDKPIKQELNNLGIKHTTFYQIMPDPTLSSVNQGVLQMNDFEPDLIIAFGGGSAMDAAKIMWMLYENPNVSFEEMSLRFIDIKKKIYQFPKMGKKAYFVAIPTSSGTGSEVTPFAVITDDKTGIKHPLADYELVPNMAIIDADFHMKAPKELTRASGIDALTHALEAYVSVASTDFTDAMALNSIKITFEHLPRAYENGENDPVAREKMANSATMAGIAFANAFLGICHSMAHKLGSFHHLPHGVANALLIEEVIRFNAEKIPTKMATFSQYHYPQSLEKYANVADFIGVSGANNEEKLEGLIKAIKELKCKIGIKSCIKDYGIEEKDFLESLDKMVEEAFDDQCTGANPRYPLMKEMKQIYLNAYYGVK